MNTLDGIIDTVSTVHPILPLFILMKSHGKLVMLTLDSEASFILAKLSCHSSAICFSSHLFVRKWKT
ncbi:hypothetical protein R3W88_014267 [Solanum pinnatisectum]|uniref:Uncharacterized protein n=1 Tax=Solanum pinnatisectum TaxID=50273 RepID=A0AAV9KR81_9SOLN|nr:hypothetical protein R3W88_014267 [Solanum pinnatisectum]